MGHTFGAVATSSFSRRILTKGLTTWDVLAVSYYFCSLVPYAYLHFE